MIVKKDRPYSVKVTNFKDINEKEKVLSFVNDQDEFKRHLDESSGYIPKLLLFSPEKKQADKLKSKIESRFE